MNDRPPSSPLVLPDVTLVAVTSVAVDPTAAAMRRSLEQVGFAAAILLSDRPPSTGMPDGIEWRRIPPITSHIAYSHFMLRELRHHIATQHLLCIQWDGYVLDAAGWRPEFLDYDYIGAPWPHFADCHTVGNGGFSLRSRRLLDACEDLGITEDPEDVAICRIHRTALEHRFGVRFAPEDVARRFAFERYQARGGEFGFHGVFNLARLISPRQFDAFMCDLELAVLNRREHRELLWMAVRHGHLRLARTIAARLYRGAGRR